METTPQHESLKAKIHLLPPARMKFGKYSEKNIEVKNHTSLTNGQEVTCTIKGFTVNAKVSIDGGKVHYCHNNKNCDGNKPNNKFGYKYGWVHDDKVTSIQTRQSIPDVVKEIEDYAGNESQRYFKDSNGICYEINTSDLQKESLLQYRIREDIGHGHTEKRHNFSPNLKYQFKEQSFIVTNNNDEPYATVHAEDYYILDHNSGIVAILANNTLQIIDFTDEGKSYKILRDDIDLSYLGQIKKVHMDNHHNFLCLITESGEESQLHIVSYDTLKPIAQIDSIQDIIVSSNTNNLIVMDAEKHIRLIDTNFQNYEPNYGGEILPVGDNRKDLLNSLATSGLEIKQEIGEKESAAINNIYTTKIKELIDNMNRENLDIQQEKIEKIVNHKEVRDAGISKLLLVFVQPTLQEKMLLVLGKKIERYNNKYIQLKDKKNIGHLQLLYKDIQKIYDIRLKIDVPMRRQDTNLADLLEHIKEDIKSIQLKIYVECDTIVDEIVLAIAQLSIELLESYKNTSPLYESLRDKFELLETQERLQLTKKIEAAAIERQKDLYEKELETFMDIMGEIQTLRDNLLTNKNLDLKEIAKHEKYKALHIRALELKTPELRKQAQTKLEGLLVKEKYENVREMASANLVTKYMFIKEDLMRKQTPQYFLLRYIDQFWTHAVDEKDRKVAMQLHAKLADFEYDKTTEETLKYSSIDIGSGDDFKLKDLVLILLVKVLNNLENEESNQDYGISSKESVKQKQKITQLINYVVEYCD